VAELQDAGHFLDLYVGQLVEQALQVGILCRPKVQLDGRTRMKTVIKRGTRLALNHIFNLMRPLDDLSSLKNLQNVSLCKPHENISLLPALSSVWSAAWSDSSSPVACGNGRSVLPWNKEVRHKSFYGASVYHLELTFA
jgi:hypothetical protein